MEIRITYKGLTKDGVKGIWCGFKPEDVTVNEEIPILYPEVGKVLKDKNSGELFSSAVLENETDKNNYEEITEEIDIDNEN